MTLEELKNKINTTRGNAFTSEQILNIDSAKLYALPKKELKKIASIMVSSSNKRVRRLLRAVSKGISESALRGSGVINMPYGEKNPDEVNVRFFSIYKKNRNEIVAELRRMINFQNMKTSTVKGAIERRKENERLVFGETREERAKREKKEQKELERRIKKGETPEQAEQAIIAKRADNIKDALIKPEFKNGGLTPDQIMSVVFKHYRKYEESHSKIIKDMGSDYIIRMLGKFSENKRHINTMKELEQALAEVDDLIESEWEQIDNEEDADFFEQMDAYARGETTEKPKFSAVDGWR